MSILTDLANKHGTDKGTAVGAAHGYTEIYSKYLGPTRQEVKKVLEIGIAGGASLMMWREYFPNATIFGVDHNENFVNPMVGKDMFIQPHFMEATNEQDWIRFEKRWGGNFDLIIDDGGHFSNQIQAAFDYSWPLLKKGGLYIIEDLHQIYLQEASAPTSFFNQIHELMHSVNEWGKNQCGQPTDSEIEFIHLYKSVAILKKR